MGSLNCDLCDLGISRIERGRESGLRPTISDQPSGVSRQIRTGNKWFPYYEQEGESQGSGIGVPFYKEPSAISGQIRTGDPEWFPYYEQDGNVVEMLGKDKESILYHF